MLSFEVAIAKALAATGAFEEEAVAPLLTTPPDPTHGNYSLPCFVLAKTMHKAPKVIAEELAQKIQLPEGIAKVEPVNGYLNFFVDRSALAKSVLNSIESGKLDYGHAQANGKTVCIDYSSPNIGKELAFHHLRSTMIGNSLARIYMANGYKVERINHLGDWGTAFGKLIVMYLREKLPTDQASLDALTVKELNVLYASFSKVSKDEPGLEDEARAAFTKLEQGDDYYRTLWLAFRAATLKELMRIYGIMGVEFDHYTGESFYEDKMPAVIDELKEKGLLTRSEERDVVMLDEFKLNPCLIRKSDGSTLYATRDLAAAIYRKKEYNFDKSLYVVDLGQALHFTQQCDVAGRVASSAAGGPLRGDEAESVVGAQRLGVHPGELRGDRDDEHLGVRVDRIAGVGDSVHDSPPGLVCDVAAVRVHHAPAQPDRGSNPAAFSASR